MIRRSLSSGHVGLNGTNGANTVEQIAQTSRAHIAIRIRPLISKEAGYPECLTSNHDASLVELEGSTKGSDHKANGNDNLRERTRTFNFDSVFDARSSRSQEEVFNKVGLPLVEAAENGYNVCIFGFGHGGTGKTFTISGYGGSQLSTKGGEGAGILPRFISRLFASPKKHHLLMSYYELYMESVRDLLTPVRAGSSSPEVTDRKKDTKEGPRMHIHPTFGPFVTDITQTEVSTLEEVIKLRKFGNQMRAHNQTSLNQRSSRSHAIFQFRLIPIDGSTGNSEKTGSLVTFCDLNFQEPEKVLYAPQKRFKESTQIDRSLSHLSEYVEKLVKRRARKGYRKTYSDSRYSILTRLMAHALTGDCKTALIATVSPSILCYDDTEAILSFCKMVKHEQKIPTIRNIFRSDVVEQLQCEMQNLEDALGEKTSQREILAKDLGLITAMCEYYKLTWEQVKAKSTNHMRVLENHKEEIGLARKKIGSGSEDIGRLLNLSDDKSLQGACKFYLHAENSLVVGSDPQECGMVLNGVGISPRMCTFTTRDKGCLSLYSFDRNARILVNGKPAGEQIVLQNRDRIIFGHSHAYRLILPLEERRRKQSLAASLSLAEALSEVRDISSSSFLHLMERKMDLDTVYRNSSESKNMEDELQSMGLDMSVLHICPLVDEANLITRYIKPDAEFTFELHMIEKVERPERRVSTSGGKEVAICCFHRPRSNITCRFKAFKERSRGIARTLHLQSPVRESYAEEKEADSLIYMWSLEKFLTRLSSFRDVYDMACTRGVSTAREKIERAPNEDPWMEMGPNDLSMQHTDMNEGYSSGEEASPREVIKEKDDTSGTASARNVMIGSTRMSLSSSWHPTQYTPFDIKSGASLKSATCASTSSSWVGQLLRPAKSLPLIRFSSLPGFQNTTRPTLQLRNLLGGGAVTAQPNGASLDNSRYGRMECVLSSVTSNKGVTKEVQQWRIMPQDYSSTSLRASSNIQNLM